jgi:hypothetical protein
MNKTYFLSDEALYMGLVSEKNVVRCNRAAEGEKEIRSIQ